MSLYELFDWLWYGFTIVIVWPIAIGLTKWEQLERRHRVIVIFLVSLLAGEVIGAILRFNLIRNHFMHYYVTLAVLWIVNTFYANYGQNRRFLEATILLIALAIPFEVFILAGFNHINTITETIAWLILTILAFINLKALIDSPFIVSLRNSSFLYYHLGFLIIGFFRAGKACFVKYFIETSLDLYFFMDTLVVMAGAIAYGLFARGIRINND